jgi:hypothetical protein
LQAVVAANKTNVIGIQPKLIFLHDYSLRCTHGHSRAANSFRAHATLGAARLAQVTRLNATKATKHALAALIVAPSTPRLYMVTHHVTKLVLSAGEAYHRSHPAARLGARSATQFDLEFFFIVCILPPVKIGVIY